jgi:hypothetical protein
MRRSNEKMPGAIAQLIRTRNWWWIDIQFARVADPRFAVVARVLGVDHLRSTS